MESAKKILFSLVISAAFFACGDEISDTLVTNEEKLVTSYLEKNPEMYSEFVNLLNASGMSDLLNAYGNYTCFAPTNEALQTYYAGNKTSFEQLTEEEIKKLAYSHIIKKTLYTIDLQSGAVSMANMADRFLYISYGIKDNMPVTYINEKACIVIPDQEVHNGVVHTIDAVLEVSQIQLPEVIRADSRFSIFAEALYLTGMADSLRMMEEKGYEQRVLMSAIYSGPWKTPPFHKYGYTAFMESDSIFKIYNIRNLDDLKAYAANVYDAMYPSDRGITDPADRRNSLNRFVSYHLVGRLQASNDFISEDMLYYYVPNTTIYEYIEPMCPNTLIEVQSGNLFNKRKDGFAVRILSPNNEAENGIYHEIDRILVYDEGVESDVLNKRIRMDAISLLPDLITNKVRGNYDWYIIPAGYAKNIILAQSSQLHYKRSRDYRAMHGDELILGGKYDVTLRIPPIPAGTYEVRIGFSYSGIRGVAQIYFDGEPCGISVNMMITGSNPRIGWVRDNGNENDAIENDKMMHNRGYMKGPASQLVINGTTMARDYSECIRRVLITTTLYETEPHYIRIKSVEEATNRELQLDYIEFAPVSYLENEDRN